MNGRPALVIDRAAREDGIVVLALWITGVYLWLLPYMARRENAERRKADRRVARATSPSAPG